MEIIRVVKDVTALSSAPMDTCTIWTVLQMALFGMMIRNAANGNLPRAQATQTATAATLAAAPATQTAEATQAATPTTQAAVATARMEFVFHHVNP